MTGFYTQKISTLHTKTRNKRVRYAHTEHSSVYSSDLTCCSDVFGSILRSGIAVGRGSREAIACRSEKLCRTVVLNLSL